MFSLEGITTSVQDWLFMKFNPTMALALECVIVIFAFYKFICHIRFGIGTYGKKGSCAYSN